MKRARHFLSFTAALFLFVAIALSATPVKKKPVRKTVATSATKRTKSSQSASRRTSHLPASRTLHDESDSGTARSGIRHVVVTRKKVNGRWVRVTRVVKSSGPAYQPHPEPERYQQIQQALAANGYFKGEPNGQWGDDSVSALKQFQTDRKLSNDGRISALTLIGLGLGPNRETASAPAPPALSPAAPVAVPLSAPVPPVSN